MKKHWLKIIGFIFVFIVLTGVLAGCDNSEEAEASSDISSEVLLESSQPVESSNISEKAGDKSEVAKTSENSETKDESSEEPSEISEISEESSTIEESSQSVESSESEESKDIIEEPPETDNVFQLIGWIIDFVLVDDYSISQDWIIKYPDVYELLTASESESLSYLDEIFNNKKTKSHAVFWL